MLGLKRTRIKKEARILPQVNATGLGTPEMTRGDVKLRRRLPALPISGFGVLSFALLETLDLLFLRAHPMHSEGAHSAPSP